MLHVILLALAPAFFVIVLGYGAGKLHIVDNHQVNGLNALVMDFSVPASLFAATAAAPRSEMLAQAPIFATLGVVMLLVYAAWILFLRATSTVSKADASVQALSISFPNFAGVGLPIASAVIGPSGTVLIAVAIASGSILISPLTLLIAEIDSVKQGGTKTGGAQILRGLQRALTKPVVLAPALGILLSLSGMKLGDVPHACLSLIGETAAGVALFLTGLILSSQAFRLDWNIVAATGLGNIVRPLLALAVVFAVPVSHDVAKTTVLLAAMPSGFFGILFAVNYRLDSAAAGSMLIASTLLSILTMSVVIAVLFPH
jgi:malonate transporter and related proteins